VFDISKRPSFLNMLLVIGGLKIRGYWIHEYVFVMFLQPNVVFTHDEGRYLYIYRLH